MKFKPFLIAEIGINHNGSVKTAKKLIDLAKKYNFDAVKFQKRKPEISTPKHLKDEMRNTPWGYISYLDYKKKIEYSVMDISASTNDSNIRLIRANLEEFIYKKSSFSEDEKFDIIICNEVIEHFDFPVGFVSFLRDLCDEGSCLVLSTPNIYNIGNLISNVRGMDGHGKIANSVVTRKNFFRYSHVTHYSEASLFDILNSFFSDVRVSQCGTINSLPRLLVDAIFWVFPRHRPSLLAIAKFPRFEKSGAAVVDCPKNGYVVPLMDERCLHKEPDNAMCRACRFAE